MNPPDDRSDPLGRALRKQEQGRGTSNTEKRLLSDFARGRIQRDHFSQIQTAPLRTSAAPVPVLAERQMRAGGARIEEVEDLEPRLRKAARDGADAATAGTEGDAISVVGSDGKLNTVAKHSTWSTPTAYPTELRSVNTGRTVRMDDDGLSVEGSAVDFLHDPVNGVGGWYTGSRKVEIDLSTAPGFDIEVTAAGGLVLTHISSGRTLTLAADGTSIRATKADGDFGSVYNTGFEAQETTSGNAVGLDANSGNGLAIDIDGVQITANNNGLVISNGSNNLTIDPALITANMSVREIDVCDGGVTKQMLIIGSAPY